MTCYKPCRSKTLFFDLNPKGAKSAKPGRAKLLGHTVDCRRHGLLWARTAGAHCGLLKAQTPVRARTANMPPTRGPIYIETRISGSRWRATFDSSDALPTCQRQTGLLCHRVIGFCALFIYCTQNFNCHFSGCLLVLHELP